MIEISGIVDKSHPGRGGGNLNLRVEEMKDPRTDYSL
jgi:hypothetical protein